MKKALEFLISQVTGSDDFEVTESESEDGHVSLDVSASDEIVGLIIGKQGRTIKSLRRILSIRGVRENKSVSINVTPKTTN